MSNFPPPLPWMQDAMCLQVAPDMMFPEAKTSSKPAKRVCRDCLVKVECLTYALDRNEHDGVWGGTSPRERARIRRASRDAA